MSAQQNNDEDVLDEKQPPVTADLAAPPAPAADAVERVAKIVCKHLCAGGGHAPCWEIPGMEWTGECPDNCRAIATAALSALAPMDSAKDGWVLVPREPTPEMLAEVLPAALGRSHDPAAYRLAERAMFLLEKRPVPWLTHQQGIECALDLIGDYRNLLAAAPLPNEVKP